jgi:integrase
MRQGELLALRWSDVSLDRKTLSVTRSLSWTKQGPVFVPPKTKKSRRQIELAKTAVHALRAHRTRQLEQRLAVGDSRCAATRAAVRAKEGGKARCATGLKVREPRTSCGAEATS